MEKYPSSITVNWKQEKRNIPAYDKLADFTEAIKDKFKLISEPFTMFSKINGRIDKIEREDNYITIKSLRDPMIIVTEDDTFMNEGAQKSTFIGITTNGDSKIFDIKNGIDEKRCTNLEIIDEGDSIEVEDENPDSEEVPYLKKQIKLLQEKIDQLEAELRKTKTELPRRGIQKALSPVYEGKLLACSVCKESIVDGSVGFLCFLCKEIAICEYCEETYEHEHALFKIGTKGKSNYYRVRIDPETIKKDYDETNKSMEVALTIFNTGKRDLPEDTTLRSEEGIILNNVGTIRSGQKRNILFSWRLPEEIKDTYKFRLFGKSDYFGQYFTIVEESPGNITY